MSSETIIREPASPPSHNHDVLTVEGSDYVLDVYQDSYTSGTWFSLSGGKSIGLVISGDRPPTIVYNARGFAACPLALTLGNDGKPIVQVMTGKTYDDVRTMPLEELAAIVAAHFAAGGLGASVEPDR